MVNETNSEREAVKKEQTLLLDDQIAFQSDSGTLNHAGVFVLFPVPRITMFGVWPTNGRAWQSNDAESGKHQSCIYH